VSEDAARAYARELVRRLAAVLGDELVGAYLVGSLALGGYEPGRSDVDVAALVRRRLGVGEKEAVVAACRHEALPCPARKVELVVSVPERIPAFELNLNSGEVEHRVDLDPSPASEHWFAIDASIARQAGVPLLGPPAAEAFPELPPAVVAEALRSSITWQLEHRLPPDDLVLNAARTRRFLDEGVWSSKVETGEWALRRLPDREVVEAALALRRREPDAELSHDAAAAYARAHALPV
jgi:predicted nucleotidyltransferase